jgi:hypothetical protein
MSSRIPQPTPYMGLKDHIGHRVILAGFRSSQDNYTAVVCTDCCIILVKDDHNPPVTPRYCDDCCMYVPLEHEPHISNDHPNPHFAKYESEAEAISDLKHLSLMGDRAAQERRTKIEATDSRDL